MRKDYNTRQSTTPPHNEHNAIDKEDKAKDPKESEARKKQGERNDKEATREETGRHGKAH